MAYITQHFNAATTVVLTTGPDYRHPDYYLRDYSSLNREAESPVTGVPATSQTLVFLSDNLISHQEDVQTVALPSGELLYSLHLDADSEVSVDGFEVSVRRP